jgi:transcriptional regulator with XRE-family HTH domain
MKASSHKFVQRVKDNRSHLFRADGQNAAMGSSKEQNPRTVLARNLKKLMDHGELNRSQLGVKSGVSHTTISRVLKESHAPDLDTLSGIAHVFGLLPWQLLVPHLDPTNPPVVLNASPQERELYERLRQAAEILTPRKGQ